MNERAISITSIYIIEFYRPRKKGSKDKNLMNRMITCSESTTVSSSSSSLCWASCRKKRSSINAVLKQLECMQATVKCNITSVSCLSLSLRSFSLSWDFLDLRHPNHFVLASTNNRNVIITYRFLAAPVRANGDFF